MIQLNFKFSDHWDLRHQLIWQNKAISLASQGGDLLETTGLFLWHKAAENQPCEPVVDGLAVMYAGVDEQLMPRVKSFDERDMLAEPDRWVKHKGVFYRVLDVSHSQIWYIWAALTFQTYGRASDIAITIGTKIINDGYKIKWNGEVTDTGDFFPWYPSNAMLRAMSIAQRYGRKVPFRSRAAYWFLPWWTWVEMKLGKYNHTDAFNTCMILYFMQKKGKLKAQIKRWPEMIEFLMGMYETNTGSDPDVIQNDMKWYFILEMEKYVA